MKIHTQAYLFATLIQTEGQSALRTWDPSDPGGSQEILMLEHGSSWSWSWVQFLQGQADVSREPHRANQRPSSSASTTGHRKCAQHHPLNATSGILTPKPQPRQGTAPVWSTADSGQRHWAVRTVPLVASGCGEEGRSHPAAPTRQHSLPCWPLSVHTLSFRITSKSRKKCRWDDSLFP